MFDHFLENIKEKKLFSAGEKVLLAVSGGIDSMVMLYLFEKSGFDYGVAHCNFQLRGSESDGDEEFVRKQVLIHGVPSWFKRFNTKEYADLNGVSIEMAARKQRYEWFEKIRMENGFDWIATAHHADDQIETFFLNISRKTGIKGLTGISEKSGRIIRPMLFSNRAEIKKYAQEIFIEYREDSTNAESVYQRNYLRNKILPLFDSLNPAFRKNMAGSIENLKDAEAVYSWFFETEKQKVTESRADSVVIDIKKLLGSQHPKLLLYEILTEFEFNATVIDEVFQSISGEPGKQFFSKTHRLVKDRHKLFITESYRSENHIYYIEKDDLQLFTPLHLSIEKLPAKGFSIPKKPDTACFDATKIEFPLLVRKWQAGDYFQPFGMIGFKKISDFLVDEKIPLHEKEKTWLLCSGEKIAWIIGHRIDNRFRIDSKTTKIIKIEKREF